MTRYFADWRFLLQQIGQGAGAPPHRAGLLGLRRAARERPDRGGRRRRQRQLDRLRQLPNTIAGMGQCMIAMVRKYAPHALVGLHASAWSTNIDVSLNTSASLDVAGEAQKTAAFLAACGEPAARTSSSSRRAIATPGYYQIVENKDTWWDATNTTLPNFHQDFAWVKALTEALGKPALYWQTPLGNASQNNTMNHYKDNRVDYFFAHMSELARRARARRGVRRRGRATRRRRRATGGTSSPRRRRTTRPEGRRSARDRLARATGSRVSEILCN